MSNITEQECIDTIESRMSLKTSIMSFLKSRNLSIYTINDSHVIKVGHPLCSDIRLCISITDENTFDLSIYLRSQYSCNYCNVLDMENLRVKVCEFEVTGIKKFLQLDESVGGGGEDDDDVSDAVLISMSRCDLDDLYDDIKLNCELGL